MIEAQIIAGELHIGERLPTEYELASLYRVSRTVIREAMKALKEKGWVETRAGRGTFVVDNVARGVRSSFDVVIRMDPDSGSSHMLEVRLFLEPEIAALSALRASEEQIIHMREAIAQMDKAISVNPADVELFLDADFTFHMTMAESTGNPLILMVINPVVKLMREQQATHVSQIKGGAQRSQMNHRLIMRAVELHDPDAAYENMRRHILQVSEDIQNAGKIPEALPSPIWIPERKRWKQNSSS